MKNIIVNATLSVALLAGLNGCGDENTTQTAHLQNSAKTQTRTLAQRKQAFGQMINALSAYGLENNLTADTKEKAHYTLRVSNAHKAMGFVMSLADQNINMLEPQEQKEMEEVLKDLSLGIDVDWTKYAANMAKSVDVYYIDHNATGILKSLAEQKKLRASLSFDEQDRLKQIDFNDLDETFTQEGTMTHLLFKGTQVVFTQPPAINSNSYAFKLKAPVFSLMTKTLDDNSTLTFGYKDIACDISHKNAYLGKKSCTIPSLTVTSEGTVPFVAQIDHASYLYDISLHDKKVKSDLSFAIKSIEVSDMQKSAAKEYISLNDMKLHIVTDNIDEALIKKFQALSQSNNPDKQALLKEIMHLAGELYKNGMEIDYTSFIKSVKGAFDDKAFVLTSYQSKGDALFDANISYEDKTEIKELSVTDKQTKAQVFLLKNMHFGYSIKDLYNVMPTLIEVGAAQDATTGMSPDIEKKMAELGKQLTQNGLKISFDPVGFETLQTRIKDQKITLGKTDFRLQATLDPNTLTLDPNDPMSAMMLIPLLQADGKLVLQNKDLQLLSKQLPPQIIGMIMMFGKPVGDTLVYELKFEKGHLLINGQPMM